MVGWQVLRLISAGNVQAGQRSGARPAGCYTACRAPTRQTSWRFAESLIASVNVTTRLLERAKPQIPSNLPRRTPNTGNYFCACCFRYAFSGHGCIQTLKTAYILCVVCAQALSSVVELYVCARRHSLASLSYVCARTCHASIAAAHDDACFSCLLRASKQSTPTA